MHGSIMVPLDGSSFAATALPTAVALARRSGATLELVHVHAPAVYQSGTPVHDRRFDDEERAAQRAELDSTAVQLHKANGVEVTATFLTGPVLTTLETHVAARAPDLLVMTTHGTGGFSRLWLGSVADGLLRRAGVPVLLLRLASMNADSPHPDDHPVFRRVLIPLDGSDRAEAVIEHAVSLGDPGTMELVLLSVVVPLLVTVPLSPAPVPSASGHGGWPYDVIEQREQESSLYLERIAAELRQTGMIVTTRVVTDVQAAQAILEAVDASHADLVALSTRGQAPLVRWVVGSVADKVVRGAQVPVLVYRPTSESDPTL